MDCLFLLPEFLVLPRKRRNRNTLTPLKLNVERPGCATCKRYCNHARHVRRTSFFIDYPWRSSVSVRFGCGYALGRIRVGWNVSWAATSGDESGLSLLRTIASCDRHSRSCSRGYLFSQMATAVQKAYLGGCSLLRAQRCSQRNNAQCLGTNHLAASSNSALGYECSCRYKISRFLLSVILTRHPNGGRQHYRCG